MVPTCRRKLDAAIAGLRPARISIVILILGFLLWTKADQSQDILISAGSWRWWRWDEFALSTAVWAWASWWFARYLSSFDLALDSAAAPSEFRIAEAVADWSPRVAGAGACLVVAYALYAASASARGLATVANDPGMSSYANTLFHAALVAVGGGVAVLIVTWKRRWITNKILTAPVSLKVPHGLTRIDQGSRNHVLALAVAASVLLLFAISEWPVEVGGVLGSENAYGLGLASIAGGLTLLASFADPARLPLLRLVLGWALAVCLLAPNAHPIRTLDRKQGVQQQSLEAALKMWRAAQPPGPHPALVIVATAGGGIRAAYWTGVVLDRMNDKLPDFHNQLFAISGVSGGSVGAALYGSKQGDCAHLTHAPCAAVDLFRNNAQVLRADLLAPPLFTLLFPDLLDTLIPLPVADRSVSFETAIEASYNASGGSDRMSSSFLALTNAGGWQPKLILNGTSVQTGERLVFSQLLLAGWSPAVDLLSLHPEMDVRVSTAANTSARFPIVEPPGTLASDGRADQIVDGGVYENFGATTAIDLVRGIRKIAGNDMPRIAVVQISSDPDLPDATTAPNKVGPPVSIFSDILGPLDALLHSRSARGIDSASLLQNIVSDELGSDGCYANFRMTRRAGSAAPPLGWVLSQRAIEDILLFWHDEANRKQFKALSSFLNGAACTT